jgi:hypothetical protein
MWFRYILAEAAMIACNIPATLTKEFAFDKKQLTMICSTISP